MSYYASKHMQDETIYQKWLEYFYSESDFGPADDDVRNIMWDNFLREEGLEEDIDEDQL